jgi:hypothetical protein
MPDSPTAAEAVEPAQPREEIYYFCDETSFIGEDFMGVGGIAMRKSRIPTTVKKLSEIREACGARGEIKWESTRDGNLKVRRAYVDYLVQLVREGKVHFHLRFAPFTQYDHTGPRRIYDTVSKMYYQLLLHRVLNYYGKKCRIFIRPDDGECTAELEKFVNALHIDGALKYKAAPDCIHSIVCLNSKTEPLLQFLDVSLGALTAYRNGRHLRPGTRDAKRLLAEHAYHAFGVSDLTKNVNGHLRLSVWNVVPRNRSPRR